jgi:hypothetical protein
MSYESDLIAAGWLQVGPVWKAPDDSGPTGRKWHIVAAHSEMTDRGEVIPVKAAAPPPKPRARPKK